MTDEVQHSEQRLLTLEREGLLLMAVLAIGLPVTAYLTLTSDGWATVSIAFMLGWFVWFFAWASKGGIPPSMVR